jgi:hypothetical protein
MAGLSRQTLAALAAVVVPLAAPALAQAETIRVGQRRIDEMASGAM